MQRKLITALADVLGINLHDLQEMSEAQQLEHLEAIQAKTVATI